MSAAGALLGRELRLALRSGGGAGLGLAFFLMVGLLVPLGIGPEPGRLAPVAPVFLRVSSSHSFNRA